MKKQTAMLPFLLLPALSPAEHADFDIIRPNFNTEHYLDLNKAEFDETMNDAWYQADNGWRISSHSLTTDLTYLHTQIKLHHELSDYASMRLNHDQEIELYDQDLQPPELEFEVRPVPRYPVSISLIGSFQYKKTGSEQGLALTYGERTKNYIRYADTTVDKYHNQKTEDNSTYLNSPHIQLLESTYHWSPSIYSWIQYQRFTPFDFIFDDQITSFAHKGKQYEAFIKYKQDKDNHYKIRVKGLDVEQSKQGTVNERQQLNYQSIDLKWLLRQSHAFRYVAGFRYDKFSNDIFSTLTDTQVVDYPFRTRQIYSTMTHQYHAQKSWELGLYLGLTNEPNDPNPDIDNKEVVETKLNFAWGYYSIDKTAAAFVHISFNLDDFNEDPGDGGGLTYQSTF